MVSARRQDRLLQVSEFAGACPNIPLPPDMLRELGNDALFVTLPVGRVDAKSRNGRVYTRAAVQAIVDAVNNHRPEGRWGHLRDDERSTRYDPPAIRWLAALMDGNGVAWAKGYPITAEAKEHFRLAKIARSKVGTSVYGYGDLDGDKVVAFELETIDIADPNRVGIPDTAAYPMITKEQDEDPNPSRTDEAGAASAGEDELTDNIRESEANMTITINDVPDAVRQQILEQSASAENGVRVAEMETQISELNATISTLTTERDAARNDAAALLGRYAMAQVAEHVQLEPVRKIVAKLVGISEQDGQPVVAGVATMAEFDAALKDVLDDESIMAMNKETFKEMMGPKSKVPMTAPNGKSVFGGVIPG